MKRWLVTAGVLVSLAGPASAEVPKHLRGTWEGPATFYGKQNGKLRLKFDAKTIELSESWSGERWGIIRGDAVAVRGGLKFQYLGIEIGSAIVSEAGECYLLDLKVKNGVLTGFASMDKPPRRTSEVVRFRLRRR